MTLYILLSLSYYVSGLLRFPPQTTVAITSFCLLPPAFVGVGAYAILRYQRDWPFAPRWLAVAALGSAAATYLAWWLYLSVLLAYNRAQPPTDFSGPDVGPEFVLVIPYMLLCAILSIVAALALPKLIGLMICEFRKSPHSDPSPPRRSNVSSS